MKKSGFTLIELSIVLVIIGLIVGGILTGRTLIKAAELRNVTTEYQRYATALTVFRDKYSALPGDMPNAVDLWGSAGGNGNNAACETTSSSTPATCNGNNDAQVWGGPGGTAIAETFRAWQHLANAGLVEGRYSGAAGSAGYAEQIPGVNQPSSKIPTGAWTLWSIYVWGTFGKSGLSLWFGADYQPTGNSYSFYPILTGDDAKSIDTKMDDGKPGSGKITTVDNASSYAGSCTGSADPVTAQYLSSNIPRCMLIFWLE